MFELKKSLFMWSPEAPYDGYTAPCGLLIRGAACFVGDGWVFEADVEFDGVFVLQKSASRPVVEEVKQ